MAMAPSMSYAYPVTIKNVLTKMTQATQSALRDKNSRMRVELPPGVDFGVEAAKRGGENKSDIKKSNREAARLFGEMFTPLSSNMVVLFPSEDDAAAARSTWTVAFRGTVLSIDAPDAKGYGKLRSRKFTALEQEQALMATNGVYVPDGTEVIIIAGPRPKDWKKIRTLHEKFGDDTLILVINTRADILKEKMKPEDIEWLDQTFKWVYHYAPPPILDSNDLTAREILMYHEFGGKWTLAEKREEKGILGSNIGAGAKFMTVWEGKEKPRTEDIPTLIVTSAVTNK